MLTLLLTRLIFSPLKNSFLSKFIGSLFFVLTMSLQLVLSSVFILLNLNITVAFLIFIVAAIDTAIGFAALVKYHNMNTNTLVTSDILDLIVINYIYGLVLLLVFICKASNTLFMPHLLLEIEPVMSLETVNLVIEPTVEKSHFEEKVVDAGIDFWSLFELICWISGFFGLLYLFTSPYLPFIDMRYFSEIQIRLSTGTFYEQLFWVKRYIDDGYFKHYMDKQILYEILNWASANREVCQDPRFLLHLNHVIEVIQQLLQ